MLGGGGGGGGVLPTFDTINPFFHLYTDKQFILDNNLIYSPFLVYVVYQNVTSHLLISGININIFNIVVQ